MAGHRVPRQTVGRSPSHLRTAGFGVQHVTGTRGDTDLGSRSSECSQRLIDKPGRTFFLGWSQIFSQPPGEEHSVQTSIDSVAATFTNIMLRQVYASLFRILPLCNERILTFAGNPRTPAQSAPSRSATQRRSRTPRLASSSAARPAPKSFKTL